MGDHECLKEQEWGKLWEILKNHTSHVIEGDSTGGFRDRVLVLESAVKRIDSEQKKLEKALIYNAAIGGVIGGLLANCIPDVMRVIFSWLVK